MSEEKEPGYDIPGLRKDIKDLGAAILRTDKESGRIKRNQRILYIVILVLAWSLIWTWSIAGNAKDAAHTAQAAADRAQKAADDVKQQSVVTCQSSNETRQGIDYVWDTIWMLFLANAKGDDRVNILALNNFTNEVYAVRDCSDPNQKFTLPPRPALK